MDFLFIFVALFISGAMAQPTPPSPPMDISQVKCFWLVFGEFNYDQANSACRIRNGSLATFNSASEDHIVRYKIDWDTVPGYQDGKFWIGQLWLGAKRAPGGGSTWQWDTPLMPGVAFAFASWIGDPAGQSGQDCVIMQKNGWNPARCDSQSNGRKFPAGAICETLTRTTPDSDITASSTNYCDVPLMPASDNNIPLPIVMRKSYFLVKGNYSFETARQACAANKGQLATLKSNLENEFIFKNMDFNYVTSRAWIGLKRPNRGSNAFNWIDGTLNTNLNGFLPGQPDNAFGGNQDCVAFLKSEAGTIGWADLPCNAFGTPEAGRAPISALCEAFVIL